MPNFQPSKIQMNNAIDTATRKASALAMRFDCFGILLFPRSMKNKALARLARIARKARATKMFMLPLCYEYQV